MSRLARRILLGVVFATFGFFFGFGLAILTTRMMELALFCGLFTAAYGLLLSFAYGDIEQPREKVDDEECDDDSTLCDKPPGKDQI